jgi:hypothetical protein
MRKAISCKNIFTYKKSHLRDVLPYSSGICFMFFFFMMDCVALISSFCYFCTFKFAEYNHYFEKSE